MEAGAHQITWDASEENGSKVTPGIYLLQFAGANTSETRKVGVINY